MSNDESYIKVVNKLKKSKSDRKEFIKKVSNLKAIHKRIKKIDSKTCKLMQNLVKKLDKAIKDSR